MLEVQLLWVTCVVMEMLAVSDVTGLSLALPSMQELWLVCMDLKLRPCLLELFLVLIVALQLAYSQRMSHLGVIFDTEETYLLALLFYKGLLVVELKSNR